MITNGSSRIFVHPDILINMNALSIRKLDELLKNAGDLCLKRRARLMVTELNPQKNDVILDAGCGDGYYLYLLSNLGEFNLTGIDYLKKNVDDAKRQVTNKKIKYFVGDISRMSFKTGTFNKIVLSEVLEHVDDDLKTLIELKRVMKKNGTLYITVPHWRYPFFWDPINYVLQRVFRTHIKSGFWAGVWNMHDRLYHARDLRRVIERAGFKIEKFENLTHYGIPFNHYLTNLGFRIRTSKHTPKNLKQTMTKFSTHDKKTWFQRILDFLNFLDQRNDRQFSATTSTVCMFVAAKKI